MKPLLSNTEWMVVFESLSAATEHVAGVVNLLDRCNQTEAACDDAKRIEMEMCILESQLRQVRQQFNMRAITLAPEARQYNTQRIAASLPDVLIGESHDPSVSGLAYAVNGCMD